MDPTLLELLHELDWICMIVIETNNYKKTFYFISYSGYSINERIRKQIKIKYVLSLLDVMESPSVA
jgi:hypothetical protein